MRNYRIARCQCTTIHFSLVNKYLDYKNGTVLQLFKGLLTGLKNADFTTQSSSKWFDEKLQDCKNRTAFQLITVRCLVIKNRIQVRVGLHI